MRYGIPDFKLDKQVVDRRIKVMMEEGVKFQTNTNIGITFSVQQLHDDFDAVVLCTGSTMPRDLPIPGRNLKGVHFAMDFLTQQNRRVSDKHVDAEHICGQLIKMWWLLAVVIPAPIVWAPPTGMEPSL